MMLSEHERDNLRGAIHGSMTRLMSNYKELWKEVDRLTQTFEDCAEECMKRAVKADRATRETREGA